MKTIIIFVCLMLPNLGWSSDTAIDWDSIPTKDNFSKIPLLCTPITREMYDTDETITYDENTSKTIYLFDKVKKELLVESDGILYLLKETYEDKYVFEHTRGIYKNYAHLNRYTLELSTGLIKDDQKVTKTNFNCLIVEKKI